MGDVGEEPRDAHGDPDPASSALGLPPPQNFLPFYPFLPALYLPDPYPLVL